MIRDILTLRSDKNLVIEYLSEDRVRIIGDKAQLTHSRNRYPEIDTIYYPDGPRYRRGKVSNFRSQDRVVSDIHLEETKEDTITVLLDLEDVRV